MELSYVPSALIIACFALLALALSQLARIQKEAIGHSRGVSKDEADHIYRRDYTDGDGATFNWKEMRDYCRAIGETSRLSLWVTLVIASIAGGAGSVFLDQALR